MKQGPVYTVIYIFILAFVFVFLLAVMNEVTKGQIAKNAVLSERRAVLDSFEIPYKSPDDAYNRYTKDIKESNVAGKLFYSYRSSSGEIFYASEFQGYGLWGLIRVVLAVNADVSRIEGIGILSEIETAGLGGRIEEADYKAQFKNKKIGTDGNIKLTRLGRFNTNPEDPSIDGISGATRTSEAMRNITNTGLAWFKAHIGEAK
jgi:Na+-transporting NADH:ubiquinone oxidoreductase subunit C